MQALISGVQITNLLAEDPTYNQGHFRDIKGVGASPNKQGANSPPLSKTLAGVSLSTQYKDDGRLRDHDAWCGWRRRRLVGARR